MEDLQTHFEKSSQLLYLEQARGQDQVNRATRPRRFGDAGSSPDELEPQPSASSASSASASLELELSELSDMPDKQCLKPKFLRTNSVKGFMLTRGHELARLLRSVNTRSFSET